MDFIGKLLLLNLLTLSCCLPVVTMGAAIAANYKVTQNLVLKIDGSLVKTYFRAFRTNFIQATWVWFGELVVIVGVVSVNGQQRELGNQLDALPEGIADAGVDGALVIGCQGENAPGHGVHDVLAGGFHDDVPGEVGGERPAFAQ